MRVISASFAAFFALASLATAESKKDTMVVETPDKSKVIVKVPNDLQVKQTGPNTYQINRNDPALKKIEVDVRPPPKH